MTQVHSDSEPPALLGGTPLFSATSPVWPPHDDQVAGVLKAIASDGSWGKYFGAHGDRLVERLRDLYQCEHVLLCSSGRAAIELALRGLGIGSGSEVVMADYDFHSNFASIAQVGAIPVLVDVRADDAQMDLTLLDDAFSSRTGAILTSHLHGGVVDLPGLHEIATERGVPVIEDACQAAGATVAGRPAGRWGDIGILSFGGSKLLTSGRGGAVLTDRTDVVQRIRRHLRGDNHAYPLSEMQAAVLLPQLDRLSDRHRQRALAIRLLEHALDGTAGLRRFPVTLEETSPAYYKVGFFYDQEAMSGLDRDTLVAALRAEGLAFDAGFQALHQIHSRRRYRTTGDFPRSIEAANRVLTLHHPILLDDTIDWSLLSVALTRIQNYAAELASPTDRAEPGH